MKIAIVSGKGGTGKTTITTAFSKLWKDDVCWVDCDVDASNMHLMLLSKEKVVDDFKGAKVCCIDFDRCDECLKCINVCRFGALSFNDCLCIDEMLCEGCGACRFACHQNALSLKEEVTGFVMLSSCDEGELAHAEMIPGQEGSGKLVSEVRRRGEKTKREHFLLDGSPGIGCSVIASISGTDVVVVVTEPTISGREDMKRVLSLTNHFQIKTFVMINKYDINRDVTQQIYEYCAEKGIEVIGQVPFDKTVKHSINQGVPITSYEDSQAGLAIRKSFSVLKERMRL